MTIGTGSGFGAKSGDLSLSSGPAAGGGTLEPSPAWARATGSGGPIRILAGFGGGKGGGNVTSGLAAAPRVKPAGLAYVGGQGAWVRWRAHRHRGGPSVLGMGGELMLAGGSSGGTSNQGVATGGGGSVRIVGGDVDVRSVTKDELSKASQDMKDHQSQPPQEGHHNTSSAAHVGGSVFLQAGKGAYPGLHGSIHVASASGIPLFVSTATSQVKSEASLTAYKMAHRKHPEETVKLGVGSVNVSMLTAAARPAHSRRDERVCGASVTMKGYVGLATEQQHNNNNNS